MCLAVTVLQPGSVYADLEDNTTYILKWENDISGQYAYEIMYKLKKSADWSTLGINSSTVTSFDLREIYNVTGLDIHELHYRVMVYFKNEGLEGKECSSTFSIIFKNRITAYLGTYDGSSISHYPAFDKINSTDIETMDAAVNNGIKHFPLVDEDSPLNSHLKVRTEKSIKSVASQYAKFRRSNIYGHGEFNKYVHQEYQYTDYVYRNDAYNYSYQYGYTGYNSSTYNYSYTEPYSRADYSVGSSPYYKPVSYSYAGYYSRTYYYYYTSSYARTLYAYNKTYLYYYRERNTYKNGRYNYRYYYYYVWRTYYRDPPSQYSTYISYTPAFAQSLNIPDSFGGTAPYASISPKAVYIVPTRYGYFTGYVRVHAKYPAPSYSYYYYNSSASYRYYRYSYNGYAYRYYRASGHYYYISSYTCGYKYITEYEYYNYISSYSYLYKYAYGDKPYNYAVTNYGYKYLTGYRNNSYEVPVYGDNSYSYRYYTTNKQEAS